MHEVFNAPSAVERLTAYAGAVRRINSSAGDMFIVLATAASVDADVVELAETTEGRRRTGARSVIGSLLTVSALRDGLDAEPAADVLALLNSPATFHHLVRASRWSMDNYQDWLADTMIRELLPTPARRLRT